MKDFQTFFFFSLYLEIFISRFNSNFIFNRICLKTQNSCKRIQKWTYWRKPGKPEKSKKWFCLFNDYKYIYKRFEALIFPFFWPFIVCKNHQNLLKQSYYSVNWLWRCHQFEFGSCFPPYFPPNHNGVKTFFEVAFEFSLKLNSQDSLKILFLDIFQGYEKNLYSQLNALNDSLH